MGAPLIQASDVAIYATQLNISNPVDNALIGQLVGEVSDMARSFCDRDWWVSAYQEQHWGKGGQLVKPKNVPLLGLTQLSIGDGCGNWQMSPVAVDGFGNPFGNSVGYWFDAKGIYLGGGWRFRDSRTPNVYLTYSAGHASLTGATSTQAFTITGSFVPNPNYALPSPLSPITAALGNLPAPTLASASTGGTLPSGTYYVVAVPLLFKVPFATTTGLLLTAPTAGGPSFNALVGTPSAQGTIIVTGPSGTIAATPPAWPYGTQNPIIGYLMAYALTSGGPYTIAGLYTSNPDYASIPQDVKEALIKETVFRYQEVSRVGVKSSSEGGQQTASYNTGPLDPQALALLMRWRRVWGSGL